MKCTRCHECNQHVTSKTLRLCTVAPKTCSCILSARWQFALRWARSRNSLQVPPVLELCEAPWKAVWWPPSPNVTISNPKKKVLCTSPAPSSERPPLWNLFRQSQVSSRLDESTVFTVSPGLLLAPILDPFWHPVGSQELHYFFERGSGTPRPGPIGAPICPSGAIGAAVESCFGPLIASGTPRELSGLQNGPRGLQNRSKRHLKGFQTEGVLHC